MKEIWVIGEKTYQVLYHHTENDAILVVSYIITHDGLPHFYYQLGIKSEVLKSDASCEANKEWIEKLGLSFVKEMILEGDFSRTSGLLTSLECESSYRDWRTLATV
jgi:hypothetical protein